MKCGLQAVGPVAVTSLLLGSGLADTTSVEQQANPNKPKDPAAQEVYNHAAIEVCNPHSKYGESVNQQPPIPS